MKHVWIDPDGIIWSLDGVGRCETFRGEHFEGWEIPEMMPVNFHVCEDRKEAIAILSNVFSQKEAQVNEVVFGEWLDIEEIDMGSDMILGDMDFGFVEDDEPKQHEAKKQVNQNEKIKGTDIEKLSELSGYKTAMSRTKISAPIRYLKNKNLLLGDVLDYGGGKEIHDYEIYDPAFNPDMKLLTRKYDTITCNYVLNVLPLEHNCIELIFSIFYILKPSGIAYFSVYQKDEFDTKSKSGFQSGKSLKCWIEFFSKIKITAHVVCKKNNIFSVKKNIIILLFSFFCIIFVT